MARTRNRGYGHPEPMQPPTIKNKADGETGTGQQAPATCFRAGSFYESRRSRWLCSSGQLTKLPIH
jgi:hypothetical protein